MEMDPATQRRIRAAMVGAGLTAEDMGSTMGMSASSFYRHLKGEGLKYAFQKTGFLWHVAAVTEVDPSSLSTELPPGLPRPVTLKFNDKTPEP